LSEKKKKVTKINVEFPMEVDCIHHPENEEDDLKIVPMELEVDDPEVPAYTAKCPECGAEVVISFNP
jgi:hypothetical protein